MTNPLVISGHPDWSTESDQGSQFPILSTQSPTIASGATQSYSLTRAQLFDLNLVYALLPAGMELVIYQSDPIGQSVLLANTLAAIAPESVRVPFRSLGGDAQIVLANRSGGPLVPSVAVYGSVGGTPAGAPPYTPAVTAFAGPLAAAASLQLAIPGSGLMDRIGWMGWLAGATYTITADIYTHETAGFGVVSVPVSSLATGAADAGELAVAGIATVLTLTNTSGAAHNARLGGHGYKVS